MDAVEAIASKFSLSLKKADRKTERQIAFCALQDVNAQIRDLEATADNAALLLLLATTSLTMRLTGGGERERNQLTADISDSEWYSDQVDRKACPNAVGLSEHPKCFSLRVSLV